MLRKTLAVAAIALASAPGALAARGGCHPISGDVIITNAVPCVVPAVACRESFVTGDHAGTSLGVITSFDFLTGNYIGYRTAYLENGAVIEYSVVGWFGGGFSTSTATVIGGTRQYAHATGSVYAESGPDTSGTYSGEVCFGN
jgi:hypothetical protein